MLKTRIKKLALFFTYPTIILEILLLVHVIAVFLFIVFFNIFFSTDRVDGDHGQRLVPKPHFGNLCCTGK